MTPLRARLASWLLGSGTTRSAAPSLPAGSLSSPPRLWHTFEVSPISRTQDEEAAHGLQPLQVFAQTRWDPIARDNALREGDAGNFLGIARMCDAMRSDGLISGIMDTLCDGLVRLPPRWTGDPYLIDRLRGRDPVYGAEGLLEEEAIDSDFATMAPASEQAAIVWDGIMGGLGVGQLVPRKSGPPRLEHLDIHWVRYRYTTDSFHYTTAAGGDYVITPGDGRWVLYTPYSWRRPWARGKWWSVALPFIQKQNAAFDRLRWHANLADPLKTIEAQAGADEKHRDGLINFVTRLWKRAAGIVTPPGYKAALVESNGRGYEVYKDGEERADTEIQVSLAGQLVSATGTNGLGGRADLWDTIRTDRIHKYASTWAHTLSRDVVDPYGRAVLGARNGTARVALDARSPAQRAAEAQALKQFADAVSSAAAMMERVSPDDEIDLAALLSEQGITLPRRARRNALPAQAPGAPRLSLVKPPALEAANG